MKNLDPLPRRVREMHVLKHHVASQSGQRGGRHRPEERFHFTGFPEKLPNSLSGADGLLELAV